MTYKWVVPGLILAILAGSASPVRAQNTGALQVAATVVRIDAPASSLREASRLLQAWASGRPVTRAVRTKLSKIEFLAEDPWRWVNRTAQVRITVQYLAN
jgi:hypothetical protein